MDFKKGDKVRYNIDGIKAYEDAIKYGDICFGIVTEVQDNPYVPNEKMITFIDSVRQKHQLREIFLEKGEPDFSYLLNLSKMIGNTERYTYITRMSLDFFESLFGMMSSPSFYLSLALNPDEIIEMCEVVINDNDGLFSSEEKQSAIKVIDIAKEYKILKNRQNELIDYLKKDNLIDVIRNFYQSLEYYMIDEFNSNIVIKELEDGYTVSYSGYAIIDNEKKLVKVEDKFIKRN